MKIKKAELVQKINKIKGIVPKVTVMPVLQSILVKDGYLIASNLETTVKAKLEGAEGELFLLPQKAFDLINNLPAGEIEITANGKEGITIQTGSIRNTYLTMDPEQFPETGVTYEGEGEFELESEDLLNAMRHVAWAIANEKKASMMSSLCLQAHDGKLNFVALDGHVIAWDALDYPGEFELLIPKNAVDKILTVGLEGKVSIRHSKTGAVFATDMFEVYTRLVEGNFYKYDKLFGAAPISTTINRTELLDAMVRAKLCTEERIPSRFEFSGISLDISLRDSSVDYHETLAIETELSETVVIGFDARLVIEALKAFSCQTVNLRMKDGKNPAMIDADDGSLKTLVLPVSLMG